MHVSETGHVLHMTRHACRQKNLECTSYLAYFINTLPTYQHVKHAIADRATNSWRQALPLMHLHG